jgi:hypothetical protein
MSDSNFAPYAPPENLERVFARVRSNGWPARLNQDYLLAVGLSEGNIPRVIAGLKFIGVIADDQTVTDLGTSIHLASEEEWPLVLQSALRTAYADVFRVVNPEDATRRAVRDAFRPMKPSGQQDRMVTMFLGLCVLAGIPVLEPPYQRPGQGQPQKPGRSVTKRVKPEDRKVQSVTENFPRLTSPSAVRISGPSSLHPSLAGIIQAVPELENSEDLERWIDSFRATFHMVKKVGKEAQSRD